jgi:NDP-sugar pyrophosphorylase family protein
MSAPRALVLTAGLGTRLRPLTYLRAKAAVPVNGETLARRAVRWLASQGITDLVLNLHHHPESITASVGDGFDLGARVRYSWEQPLLGSAGGPRHALPLLIDRTERDAASQAPNPEPRISTFESRGPSPDSPAYTAERLRRGLAVARTDGTASGGGRTFVIINGDTITDVDLTAMARRHVASGALVTMALIPNPQPEKYGGVVVSDSEIVTGFTRAGATRENYHFIGVQFAEARTFADLADGVPAESVNALYPRLMASEPGSIAAFISSASFQDIGTPADYLRTSVQLAQEEGDRLAAGRNVQVAASATVRGTAVWDDVVIGAHATLIDCIVGDGARIPDRAKYERCAIVPAGERSPVAGERIDGGLLVAALG